MATSLCALNFSRFLARLCGWHGIAVLPCFSASGKVPVTRCGLLLRGTYAVYVQFPHIALPFIPPPRARPLFQAAQAAGRAGGRSALARGIRGSRRRKRQTAKYFFLPSSVTHAKEVCSSTFGIALAPLTAEKATTPSSDRPLIFRCPYPTAGAPSSPHGEHGRFRPVSLRRFRCLCPLPRNVLLTPPKRSHAPFRRHCRIGPARSASSIGRS